MGLKEKLFFWAVKDTAKKVNDAINKKTADQQKNQQEQNTNTQEASGKGGSPINITSVLKPETKHSYFFWVAIVLLVLLILWYFNIWRASFYYAGLIIWIGFIFWGFYLFATSEKDRATPFVIAWALLIWLLDTNPLIGSYLGQPYAGFDISLSQLATAVAITLPLFMTSGITFAFLYINMVFKIIKKEYVAFLLVFFFILITNSLMARYLPRFYGITVPLPFNNMIFLFLIVGGFIAAMYLNGKNFSAKIIREVPGFFTYLFMIFVFTFFWFNSGWMSTPRAWLHAIYIILFGFLYIMPREKDNPVLWHILIPMMLLIDFFGYGFLINTFDYEWVKFIPTLVIFVLTYCYQKTENTYALTSFIVLVTLILILSIQAYGFEAGSGLPFKQRTGADLKDFLGTLGDRLKEGVESRLDVATAGLYRGSVEKNRYESLGVYFGNIRAADPRFYTDEAITVWGTLRSKTYKDAVIINFSCYRWKDSKRIGADQIIPNIMFPIFTLEEVDTQCTFLPKPKEDPLEARPGANTVTFSAEYNFATDAYLKAYFMDRERFRANAREGIDPLTQFGIKEKNPVAVFTNGPVEIGMGTISPITVSDGYAVKPSISITLTNRKEIQDKDKRIITRWDGKIKNITELVLLTPPNVEIKGLDDLSLGVACNNENFDKGKCPCSMPFVPYDLQKCYTSCSSNVMEPCNKACINSNAKDEPQKACISECETTFNRCSEECKFLFEPDDSAKGQYNGYALDVGSLKFKDLNKDIDKHRSFVCRFEPSPQVLDDTPITTRYFRTRARYNYVVENSVTVNIERSLVPSEVIIDKIPEIIPKTVTEIRPDSTFWFEGLTNELIAGIAFVESGFKHCCKEPQSYGIGSKIPGARCTKTDQKDCDFNYLITSGSSYGIMQINYLGKNRAWADDLAKKHCGGDTKINNYDCNVKVGIAILKSKYDSFKDGCGRFSGIRTACSTCKSNRPPYTPYAAYRGVEAALRGYNGWGCGTNSDTGYVEKVLGAAKTMSGVQIVDPATLSGITRGGSGMADPLLLQKPAPPGNAQAKLTPGATNSITISWNPSPTPNSKYAIYRYDQSGVSTPVYDIQATSYIDSSVQSGIEYYYKITAYSDFEESDAVQTNLITPS